MQPYLDVALFRPCNGDCPPGVESVIHDLLSLPNLSTKWTVDSRQWKKKHAILGFGRALLRSLHEKHIER